MAGLIPVGIDLGTSFCAVSYINSAGSSEMIPNDAGETLTPSVVHFGDDEVTVGNVACEAALVSPERVADNAKRDMGLDAYRKSIAGQDYPPEVIQSCILRRLRADIVAAVGENFQAVITVPAYFDEARRQATWDAATMSGLPVLDIVNEPTAAALAFGERLGYLTPQGTAKECLNVLVYDLGGGTFDVTVIRLAADEVRTLATDGDYELGGVNWDQRLAEHARDQFAAQGMNVDALSPVDEIRLLRAARDTKHALTDRPVTVLEFTHGERSYKLTVTRDDLEDLTADLLERTLFTTKQAVQAADVLWKDIDRLILVGGSSCMPAVARELKKTTGLTADTAVSPDEAVARGAAIFAQFLLGVRGLTPAASTLRITDVNSHSLGIEGVNLLTLREEHVVLIPRNTPLPCDVQRTFITRTDNQPNVRLKLLEGESSLPGECSPLATAKISNLPSGLPKGTPIEVHYSLHANGRLAVRAAIPSQGDNAQIELQRVRGLAGRRVLRWQQVVCRDGGFRGFQEAAATLVRRDAPARLWEPSGSLPLEGRAGEGDATGTRRAFPHHHPSPSSEGERSSRDDHFAWDDDEPADEELSGVAAFSQRTDLYDPPLNKPDRARRAKRPLAGPLIAYIVGGLIGLAAGYEALRWLRPDLRLPSVWQESSDIQSAD